MITRHRRVHIGLVLLSLVGCGSLAPSQLQGTATVLGCWPYGSTQPPPPKTVVVPTQPTREDSAPWRCVGG